jgi:ABC-type Co2+ transport system permease subunit
MLFPAVIPFLVGRNQKPRPEDLLLGSLSAALFVVLYLMTNPAYIGSIFGSTGESVLPVGKAVLGGTLWSIAVVSVLFVLAVLFCSRLISENRRLKSDKDLFI